MLKKTLTEIFTVWELIKKPISIHKIKLKRCVKQINLNNRKSVIDINTAAPSLAAGPAINRIDLIVRKLVGTKIYKFIIKYSPF
jgi:hypothetical protein